MKKKKKKVKKKEDKMMKKEKEEETKKKQKQKQQSRTAYSLNVFALTGYRWRCNRCSTVGELDISIKVQKFR